MNECQLLRNQSTNRIRNLIEEREREEEGVLQEGRIRWDLSRSRKRILSQARENMRPRCNFFFLACYFWLPKTKKKWSRKGQWRSSRTNKQTNVICDPSIWSFYPAGADHVPSSLFHYYYITYFTYGPQHVHVIRLSVPGCDNCLHKANLGSHFSH